MPEEGMNSETFGIQAAGTTPKNENSQVHEASLIPEGGPSDGQQPITARQFADKYETPEDLEKGYMELQQKFSEARPKTSDMTIEAVLDAAGLKAEQVTSNWAEDGRLTDVQYDALSNLGFSRSVIDQFFQGQTAIGQAGSYAQQAMERNAHDLCGGSEEWDGLCRWAGQHLPNDRVDELNERLQNPQKYEGAIKEMLWDYKMQTGRGSSSNLVSGESMPNTQSGFTNVNDVVMAMRTARQQGYMDESTKKRIANTPQHILQGVDG